MEKIKIYMSRILLKVFWLLPLNQKQIFFSSYEGKQYSCNPKTMYLYIKNKDIMHNYKYIYEYNDEIIPDDLKENNTTVVKHNSIKYIFYIMTSKYLITNSGISCCFPLRKSQINVNTWHGGGAYKKVGYATSNKIHNGNLSRLEIGSKQTTFLLSSSKTFSKIMSKSTKIDSEKIVEIGMPRNDILFDINRMKIVNQEVRKKLLIAMDDYVVLYAPTYRGNSGSDNYNNISFDVKKIKKEIGKKVNKNVKFLFRAHYFNDSIYLDRDIINVGGYPDMQDLLIVADTLITDYSSSIWDYSFTKKPCFLYVDDLDEYNINRGFESPIEKWPGIVCKNEDELIYHINNFDNIIYQNKIKQHLNDLKNCEKGIASSLLYNILGLDN